MKLLTSLTESSEITSEMKDQIDLLNTEIDEFVMSLFRLDEEQKQAIRNFNLED